MAGPGRQRPRRRVGGRSQQQVGPGGRPESFGPARRGQVAWIDSVPEGGGVAMRVDQRGEFAQRHPGPRTALREGGLAFRQRPDPVAFGKPQPVPAGGSARGGTSRGSKARSGTKAFMPVRSGGTTRAGSRLDPLARGQRAENQGPVLSSLCAAAEGVGRNLAGGGSEGAAAAPALIRMGGMAIHSTDPVKIKRDTPAAPAPPVRVPSGRRWPPPWPWRWPSWCSG